MTTTNEKKQLNRYCYQYNDNIYKIFPPYEKNHNQTHVIMKFYISILNEELWRHFEFRLIINGTNYNLLTIFSKNHTIVVFTCICG